MTTTQLGPIEQIGACRSSSASEFVRELKKIVEEQQESRLVTEIQFSGDESCFRAVVIGRRQ